MTTLWIQGAPITSAPPTLWSLRRLEWLKLVRCGLADLPEALAGLESLKTLSLDQNQFRTLPDVITKLANLKSVVLHGNPILREEIERLRAMYPQLDIRCATVSR